MLRTIYQLSFISILEPFSDIVQIYNFKVQLTMEKASGNCNGKIWIFGNSDIDCTIFD